jgi:hypothetical protein
VRTHGRLTGDQLRRLFFHHSDGRLVTVQAVNARLRKLVEAGLVDVVVVNRGQGSGPYAYGLGPTGRSLLQKLNAGQRGGTLGPIFHQLEIAEFRVRLQEDLGSQRGQLVEWLGEPALRALLRGQRGWPVPDAVVYWRLAGREGSFFLEWDRGSESLAILTMKLTKYRDYWRALGHRRLLPGLGLKPRLAIVVASDERRERLEQWLRRHPNLGATVVIGTNDDVLDDPLGSVWWRADQEGEASLFV